MVTNLKQNRKAQARVFRDLHTSPGIFVMPCAWDAGSARLLESLGFQAIGTTSGGINWSAGRLDYVYTTPRETMLVACGAIAESVGVPVSGDLENGYGASPEQVAETIRLSAECGMVGGSIEDRSPESRQGLSKPGLIPLELAIERIRAAREAADSLDFDYTLTARAESYFGGVDNPFDDALERASRYRAAGADCIFVPGLSDIDAISRFADSVDAPLSVGIGSGGGDISLSTLRDAGVRRLSTGGGLLRHLYAVLEKAGKEILESGSFAFTSLAKSEDDIHALFSRKPDYEESHR